VEITRYILKTYLNCILLKCILAAGILLMTHGDVMGQSYSYIGVAGNYYRGELAEGLENAQPGIAIGYQHSFDGNFSIYTSLHIGRIQGQYEPGEEVPGLTGNREVNRYFSSDITSLQAGINWTWLRWTLMHSYVGLGLGMMNFSIEDQAGRNINEMPDTRIDGEGYSTQAMYSPIQIGINLFHSKKINILLEHSWNLTNTDYLDNIGYLGKKGSDTIVKRMVKIRYRFR